MSSVAHWKAKSHRAEYDEMRERLTTAAWQLAGSKGLDKLTLNGVAAQAGCARSSVYRYFDNKEQLLGAVLQDRVLALGAELEKELQRYDDPKEQLVRGLHMAVSAVRSGPSLELIGTLLAQEGQEVADIMLEYICDIASDILTIDPVFGRAREQGLLREGITDQDIMRWLVTVAISLVQQSCVGGRPDAELAYLRKMLLPSIFSTTPV